MNVRSKRYGYPGCNSHINKPLISRSFCGGIPKLPYKKEDQYIPKYLYDLQERMVTKFQFEKLIPDNLQQIYSEYVGQLEKDYAELYPLIKEFADKTEEELLAVKDKDGESLYARFSMKEPNFNSTYIGRKDPLDPDYWLMRLEYSGNDKVGPQSVGTCFHIGRFTWKNFLTEPRSQGRIYYQANNPTNSNMPMVFSFITHVDWVFDQTGLTIRGNLEGADLKAGKFADMGFMYCDIMGQLIPHKLSITLHPGQNHIRTNTYLGDQSALYLTCSFRSKENFHKGAVYMDHMHFDQDQLEKTSLDPSKLRGYFIEGDTAGMSKAGVGKYAYAPIDSDVVQLYEGEMNVEYRYTGRGKLDCTNPQARQIGVFEDGAIVLGTTETAEYKYEGEYQTGMQHGKGKAVYVNGDSYEGEWVEGTMHGKGTYKYKDGNVYTGEFDRNALNGQGEMMLADGGYFVGVFEQNRWLKGKVHGPTNSFPALAFMAIGFTAGLSPLLQSLYQVARVYWINFMNRFKPADQMVYFSVYEGAFDAENLPDGFGVYTDITGNKYEGEYRNGNQTGLGKSITYFGDKYTGEFREGSYHGRGRLEMPRHKQVYEGEFSEGSYHGYGKLTTTKSKTQIVEAGTW